MLLESPCWKKYKHQTEGIQEPKGSMNVVFDRKTRPTDREYDSSPAVGYLERTVPPWNDGLPISASTRLSFIPAVHMDNQLVAHLWHKSKLAPGIRALA